MNYGFKIIVDGDYACFTRPEMKVERVSYDVPTPCALIGLIKSIYWKPAIKIVIDEIVVFNPIKFINIRRNELKDKISFQKVKKEMNGKGSIIQYREGLINQRSSLILKDVKYGISFHFEMTGLKSNNEDECEEKHYNIMLRRLRNGQNFRQPCLGCREFSVNNIELVDEFDYMSISKELQGEVDLGYMLYEMKFIDGGKPINNDWDNPIFSDKANAIYYRPIMENGIINVKKLREVRVC